MKFVGKAIELIQLLRNTKAADAELVEHPTLEKPEKSTPKATPLAPPTESLHDSDSLLLTLTLSTITGTLNALQQSKELCDALHEVLSKMVSSDQKYNHINLTAPRKIPEPNFPMANVARTTSRVSYYRWRASTESQCLSVRASEGIVELFLIQADDIPLLSFSEFGSRLKGRFELTRTTDGYGWMLGKSPADFDQAVALIQRCLTDLLDEAKDADGLRVDKTQPERHGATDSVQQLMLEKENLILGLRAGVWVDLGSWLPKTLTPKGSGRLVWV